MRRDQFCLRLGRDERALLERLKLEVGAAGVTALCRDAAVVVAVLVLEERQPRVRFDRERDTRRAILERIAARLRSPLSLEALVTLLRGAVVQYLNDSHHHHHHHQHREARR